MGAFDDLTEEDEVLVLAGWKPGVAPVTLVWTTWLPPDEGLARDVALSVELERAVHGLAARAFEWDLTGRTWGASVWRRRDAEWAGLVPTRGRREDA